LLTASLQKFFQRSSKIKIENMKTLTTLFGTFFGGGKIDKPSGQAKSTPVSISYYSQQDVLQQKMQEEKLTHGQTVTANLSPVRMEFNFGKVTMYFCPMKRIQVLETLGKGDGGRIPSEAIVEELDIPKNYKSGLYNLKNVILTSNGTMQIKATNNTAWERIK
jgi:hypothetical protein